MKLKFQKVFSYFNFFYHFIGSKIFILVGLSLVVGVLDGFGLALFLPLLEMTANPQKVSGENLGNLSFLTTLLVDSGFGITLGSILISMVTLFVMKGALQFIEGVYRASLRKHFVKNIRFQMIDGISDTRYQAFVSMDAGMIQNTISGEVWRIINAFNHYFTTLQSAILLLIYIALAFLSNAQFALLVACGGVITNFVYTKIYRLTKSLSISLSSSGHVFQSLLIQSVQYFKYLKATASLPHLVRRLKDRISGIEDIQFRMGRLNALLMASREPMIVAVVAAVILFQVNFLGGSLATIILSLLFFYRSLSYLVNVQNAYNNFLNNVGALENAQSFIDTLKTNRQSYAQSRNPSAIELIRLEDVGFAYDDTTVIKGVSLSINGKTTVAFVGESGSGKTTLVNIITGLLDTFTGSVKINGESIREIDVSAYQSRIGYITQEPVIFSDTLFNNVTLWKEPTPENLRKFENVIRQVALWNFYESLPEGSDTLLGDYGHRVSGGQRQRISIARELFKEIEILVMDEATAALDSETERFVQDNIDLLQGQLTVIIIAHRLSTVKNADHIYLLDKGTVEAEGSFDSLVHSSIRFKKMVTLQEV